MSETAGVILVVDDDPDVREGLELLLGRHGYTVISAGDGTEALERLRTDAAPGLILLDLMMPTMNGIELERRLKSNQAWASIPIVVITGAGARVADRLSAMQLDVIPKPFDISLLLATVGRLCRKPPS